MSLSKHLTRSFEAWKGRAPVKTGLHRISLTFLILLLGTPISLTAQECELEAPNIDLGQDFWAKSQAGSLSESERTTAAKRAWREALQGPIEKGTDNPTYYYFGVLTQVQLGNYARVDSLLDVFLEKAPDGCRERAKQIRFQAWANLYNEGINAYNNGDNRKALRKLTKANVVYTDARSLVNAAVLHEQMGNYDEAKELYKEALKARGAPQQIKSARKGLEKLQARDERDADAPEAASSDEEQGAESGEPTGDSPKSRVADSFGAEAAEMGFQQKHLRQRANPHGPGTLVCSSKTQFSGFTRIPLWFAWEDRIYALNGPALTISGETFPPGYPRPESAPRSWWKKAGLIPNPIQKGIDVCYPTYETGGG